MGTTYVSTDEWMDKVDVAYTLDGMLQEWNLAICDNINGPPGNYAKLNKSEKGIPYDLS